MIIYGKSCNGLLTLFRYSGTSWPSGVLPGLFAAGIGVCLGRLEDVDTVVSSEEDFLDHPYPFALFVVMLSFLIVFRSNSCYGRYWAALGDTYGMGSKWFDAACMTIAFDAHGDVSHPFLKSYDEPDPPGPRAGEPPEEFFYTIAHLFSLMHALALQHLRDDPDLSNLEMEGVAEMEVMTARLSNIGPVPPSSDELVKGPLGRRAHYSKDRLKRYIGLRKLPVIGRLSQQELDEVVRVGSTAARVSLVESWIMRRLIARQKHEPAGDMISTSPPILSRLFQNISDGHLRFHQACKTAEVPFPFPYQNLLRLFLWIYTFLVPVAVNAKVVPHSARFVATFLGVWSFFALCDVGDNLEDPFLPYDPNELPLQEIQHSFNGRLLATRVLPKPVDLPAHRSPELEANGGCADIAEEEASLSGFNAEVPDEHLLEDMPVPTSAQFGWDMGQEEAPPVPSPGIRRGKTPERAGGPGTESSGEESC
mmetsp:Transcript_58943/g.133098  ORF Transcript_58943/g.133098 Transcript_58943/m.133098 type:complete len:479 (-) Transcript_58943:72-1508(-)